MARYLIVTGDFVRTGGMDRANHALASYLLARGDEVRLVAYRVDQSLLGHPGATWRQVPKPLGSYLLGHPVLARYGRHEARRFSGRVIVNGGNCRWGDVNWLHHMHVHDVPPTSGPLARRLRRGLARRLYVRDERACLARARTIITTCEQNRRAVVDWLGLAPERVHVVYLGTDAETFFPATADERRELRARLGLPEVRPLVAFVGALGDRRKGFDTLFAAWRVLCQSSDWDGDLVVVGSGAELPAWRERARDAGLSARVHFLGRVPEVADVFRASDAHALPSRYEGYSLVTQEALCCGLPAFVTASAGIAERFPAGLRQLLIPDPDDALDLAARLRRWREGLGPSPADLASFAETLRASTWDRMAERFLGIVESSG